MNREDSSTRIDEKDRSLRSIKELALSKYRNERGRKMGKKNFDNTKTLEKLKI